MPLLPRRIQLKVMAICIGMIVGTLIFFLSAESFLRWRLHMRLHAQEEAFARAVLSRSAPPVVRRRKLSIVIGPSSIKGLGYELRPNLDTIFVGVKVRTNRWGARGAQEITVEKPPHTIRIACLGDSFTFGWGLPENETYPRVLETLIRRRFPSMSIQVHNWGVPAYNTAQEVLLFKEKVRNFHYDIVVLGFMENDVGEPLMTEWTRYPKPKMEVVDMLRRLFGSGMQSVKLSLDCLAKMAKEDGFKVIIALLYYDVKLDRKERHAVMKEVKRYAEKLGFGIVDTKDYIEHYLRRTGRKNSRCLWLSTRYFDYHPNRAGASIIAQGVFDYLCKLDQSEHIWSGP